MISLETRKEIFIRYFIKYNKIRLISRELGISRNTVTKVIHNIQIKIKELKLENEKNLIPFIDIIVIQPQRAKRIVSRYKVKNYHVNLIKVLVIENERQRVLNNNNVKTNFDLYCDFLKKNNEFREYVFSYATFYNVVREIKKSFQKQQP